MDQFEVLTFTFGTVRRRHASIASPTLLALPEAARPASLLACASCPAGSWYHDEERLACHCAARRYVSWLKGQRMIALCDDREVALMEQEPKPDA
jgi:hypothetical protein